MTFTVVDKKTGKYPDIKQIALEKNRADGTVYCSVIGFALLENGALLFLDTCGRYSDVPEGRFTVIPIKSEAENKQDVATHEDSSPFNQK